MSNSWLHKKGDWDFNKTNLNYTIDQSNNSYSFQISDNNAEPIMTISPKGEVVWHQTRKAREAGELFCDQIQMGIESETIKQTRYEWEDRILEAMKRHAEIEPLTPEVLTDVFKKCIMIDKLKGIK